MLQNVLKGVVLAAAVIVAASAPPLWSISAQESVECNKERYAEKFGDPYSILTQPIKPAMQGGFVVAKVSYKSLCPIRGSSFTASVQKKDHMEIVIIARSEPVCRDDERLSTAVDHSEVISVELPAQASADKKFLAFPPDGEYELWLLGERETVGQNLEDMGMDPILDEAVELDFKGHREVLLA